MDHCRERLARGSREAAWTSKADSHAHQYFATVALIYQHCLMHTDLTLSTTMHTRPGQRHRTLKDLTD